MQKTHDATLTTPCRLLKVIVTTIRYQMPQGGETTSFYTRKLLEYFKYAPSGETTTKLKILDIHNVFNQTNHHTHALKQLSYVHRSCPKPGNRRAESYLTNSSNHSFTIPTLQNANYCIEASKRLLKTVQTQLEPYLK